MPRKPQSAWQRWWQPWSTPNHQPPHPAAITNMSTSKVSTALIRNVFLAPISLQVFFQLLFLCIILRLLVRDAYNLSLSAAYAYSSSDISTDLKKRIELGQNLAGSLISNIVFLWKGPMLINPQQCHDFCIHLSLAEAVFFWKWDASASPGE